MTYQGYAHNTPKDSSTNRIVAITAVDPASRTASGMTRERSTIQIDCSFPVGGIIHTPAVGEQWYVERLGVRYILSSRLPANAPALLEQVQEGQVQVGSTGPLTLHGSEVQVKSALKLGETLYRDLNGVLQRSLDGGQNWTAAASEGGGLITSVSGKTGEVTLVPSDVGLGDIDGRFTTKADLVDGKVPLTQLPSQGVQQYATESAFPTTGSANTLYVDKSTNKIFIWSGLSYLVVGGAEIIKAIMGSGGSITDLTNFFDGFNLGSGSLINQVLSAIASLAGGDLTNLTSLLNGIGSLGSQITQAITGLTGSVGITELTKFFEGFTGFNPLTGAGTLVKQLVSALSGGILTGGLAELTTHFGGLVQGAGTFLQQIIRSLTGVSLNSSTLSNLQTFFTNIRSFLGNINFLPGGTFDIVGSASTFINSVLKQTGLLSFLGDIQQWLTGTVGGNLQTFFTNLRAFLGNFNFLSNGFTVANAASTFITSVLNPQGILATFSTLQTQLTGVVGGSLQNFFANLRKLLNLGTGNNLINLLVDPTSFDLVAAINSFIDNVLSVATKTLSATLIPALDITKINDLVAFLTGKTTGLTSADLDVFFGNLRRMLNIGPGVGQINMLVTQSATALRTSLFSVLSEVNATVQTYITQTGLGEWLGVTVPAQIGNFFTNLTKLFKIVDFGLDPAAFLTNLPSVAGNFIRDVINVATGQLINPLKIASTGALNTLADDLGVRPLLNDLITWFSVDGVTNNLQKFFTNFRNTLGLSDINFLSGFDLTAARNALFGVITTINNTVGTLAKQVDLALRPTFTAIVQAVTGITDAVNLTPITSFFSSIVSLSGDGLLAKLLSYFTSLITGGTTALSDFFAGFNSVAANTSSLMHKIISAITGNPAVAQTLTSLQTFFGGFTSTASTLIGRIIADLTSIITGITGGITLGDFFSGFNNASTVVGSLADKIAKAIGGPTATALSDLKTFFDNLRNFLGVNFFDPALTSLTSVKKFIEDVLAKSTGVLNAVNIPKLALEKIDGLVGALGLRPLLTDLVQNITGATNGTLTTLQSFFSGFSAFTGANGLLAQLLDAVMGSSTATLANLKTFFSGFDAFTGANGILKQISSAITGSPLTAATLQLIKDFFANIRLLLGSLNFLDPEFANKLGTNLDTFINTMLKPRGIFMAVADMASYIGGNALTDVERFLKNLASLFGIVNLRTTLPTDFNARSAGTQFLNNILLGTDSGDVVKFFTNIRSFLGTGIVSSLFGNTFDPISVLSQFVSRLADQTKLLPLLSNGKLDVATIPQISVDFLSDIKKYVTGNFIQPLISTLVTNSKISLPSLGIDPSKLGPEDFNLTMLGTWANNLVTNLTKIPAENIFGTISSSLLGVIPVGHISQTTPNLLALGSFSAPSTVESADGWSWDGNTNRSGVGGTAALTISSPKNRELYSRQAVPVIPGDNLTVSAYILTSGLNYTGGNPISLNLRFYNGKNLVSTVTPPTATTGSNSSWPINPISGTYIVPSGVTSVIVSLAVSSSVTGGTVWFDDVVLTKPGLLKQGLVDQLVDGWNTLWNNIFNTVGGIGAYLARGDILGALGAIGQAIAGAAGTAFGAAQTAIGQIATLGGQLFSNFTGAITAGVTNLGNFIANIGTGIMDAIGSTVGGFIGGLQYILDGGKSAANVNGEGKTTPIITSLPVYQETFPTPRTVPEMLIKAEQIVTTTYNTSFATDTQSSFWNTPRTIPSWLGAGNDDVSFPQSLIEGTTSAPPLGTLVLIPIKVQQNRNYDAIRFGLKATSGVFSMNSLYVGLYSVNATTGECTKVIGGNELGLYGDVRKFLDPNYDVQTIPIGKNIGGLTRSTSGNGTTATLALSTPPDVSVGQQVVVAGVTPPAYNGVQTVTGFSNLTPDGYDQNIYNTTMLLHGNGTNGATVFTDSSPAAVSPTLPSGGTGVTVSTAQSKFGGASLSFNGGTTAYISRTAQQQLGAQDFTLETWIRPTAYPASGKSAGIYSHQSVLSYGGWENLAHTLLLTTNGALYYGMNSGNTSAARYAISSANNVVPLNTWTHVAVVRKGTVITLYVNGTPSGTVIVNTVSLNTFSVGAGIELVGWYQDGAVGAYPYTGFIDDLRITKNVARYDGSFTPPAAAFSDAQPTYSISYASAAQGAQTAPGLVTVTSPKSVQTDELYYVGILQVGGTANGMSYWNKAGDLTTGQFPRFIGATYNSVAAVGATAIGALPGTISNGNIDTGVKYWSSLGAYRPYVAKGSVFYTDSFNRVLNDPIGVSWLIKYGTGGSIVIAGNSDVVNSAAYSDAYTTSTSSGGTGGAIA